MIVRFRFDFYTQILYGDIDIDKESFRSYVNRAEILKFLLTLNLVTSHNWKPTNSSSLVRVTRLFVFFACESDRRGHFSPLKSQTRLYRFLLFTIEEEEIGFLRSSS